jgi:hypothetical protein
MYSKWEVSFTAVLALSVWLGLNSKQDVAKPRLQGPSLNLVDGSHPPPTILPLPHVSWGSRALLQADGTQPPPPIKPPNGGSPGQLQADGTQPPPPIKPPNGGSPGQLQADGTQPPAPILLHPKFGNEELFQSAGTPTAPPRLLAGSSVAS